MNYARYHELCISILDIPLCIIMKLTCPLNPRHAVYRDDCVRLCAFHLGWEGGVTHTPWAPSSSSSPPIRMSGGARDTDALRRLDTPLCWWHHREGHRERMKTETVLIGLIYVRNNSCKKLNQDGGREWSKTNKNCNSKIYRKNNNNKMGWEKTMATERAREREIAEGMWCVSSLSLLIHPSVSLPQCIMVRSHQSGQDWVQK